MDDEERMLATALRDLRGPAPGMVYSVAPGFSSIHVMADEEDVEFHRNAIGWLPDIAAPANWGVWLAWMQSACWVQSATVQIGPKGSFCEVDPVQGRSGFVDGPRGPASNLLAAFMLAMPDGAPPVPSSVTAWWRAQQERSTPMDDPALELSDMAHPSGVRTYTVATFHTPGRLTRGSVNAYTRDYNTGWPGCVVFKVQACSGKDARRMAVTLRLELAKAEEFHGG